MSGGKSRPRPSAAGEGAARFRLPPALAKVPPGRQRLPRHFVEQNQRDRIILAGLDVFGEKGYAAATVRDLIGAASLSRATFYKYFSSKDDCFRAVHEEVLAWLEEGVREAAGEAPDWPRGVRSGSETLLRMLAEDPRLARICAIEWILAEPEVHSSHEGAVAKLCAGLRDGRTEWPSQVELPDCLETFLVEGAISVASKAIVFGGKPRSEELARELSEFLLLPYLGLQEARRIVRSCA
jgi:AcrR family transcriptional regulator